MFKIVMTTAVIILAIGWIAYGIWEYMERQKEKNEPKRSTEHLENVKKSFQEYAKKIEDYKLKPYERKEKDKT
jgi:hypothetical protein